MTKKQKLVRKRVYILLLLFILFLLVFVFFKFSVYFRPLVELTFEKKIELKKAEDQRINVMLLGIGGGKHEGPLLTDTIIFASIDPEKLSMTLVSVPRDLWVDEIDDKVNKIYAYSEAQEKGSGLPQTKKVLEEILGQKIDYGFRIDFNGFIKAVDTIGGLDVEVERTFDDYAYPLSGKENDLCGHPEDSIASLSAEIATGSATDLTYFPCRFEHLHFDQGKQRMNGETALKFVRSRHALGVEGSDFARSKRQEKIIRAVKDKIFSVGTFLNPVKLIGLFDIVRDSIDTDIKEEEFDDFIKLAQKMKDAKINSVVLNVGDEEGDIPVLLTSPQTSSDYGYQWVIIPKAGKNNYTEIHNYVMCVIKYNGCKITPTATEND